MASNLRVDTILPSTGTTLGIGTASGTINFLGNSNIDTSGTLTAASASITGNLGVGGTLTYEDVTNIDSVGVITARNSIKVTSGDILLTGGDGRKISFAGDGSAHYIKMDNSFNGPVINGYGGIKFETNGTNERLRIHSGGQVSIGSATEGHADADELTLAGTRTGLTIRSASDNYGNIFFSDATSGADEYVGAVQYYHADNSLRFKTSSTDRLLISSAGYVTKPNQPIFDVCGASGNPSGAGYITYTTVKVNIGSHYSTGTGKFTAPVAGTYFFSFGCIKSGNSELARLYLYKNGSSANDRHLRMPTGGDGYGENGALTNIVTLAANDEIQVYMSEGTVHGGTAYLYFNGYLIG